MSHPQLTVPRLVGMVHLGPLPGAPHHSGDLDQVIDAAIFDAATLVEAGFEALIVENFGDAPFFGEDVPKATVAAMTRAVVAVREVVEVPLGVNVLRNDAVAALAVAAATGVAFIRVNVLSGAMVTDQGILQGQAAEVARARHQLAPDTAIWADVHVKHAVPLPGATLEEAAADTFRRAGADALIVSGVATGSPVDPGRVATVRKVVPEAPLLVGSGVSAESVAALLEIADGVIVGTAVKERGVTTAAVDPRRAAAFVAAAGKGA